MHPHMASTIEFLIIWLKQWFLVTLIKYFVCILLFKTHLQKHVFENQLALQTKKTQQKQNKIAHTDMVSIKKSIIFIMLSSVQV